MIFGELTSWEPIVTYCDFESNSNIRINFNWISNEITLAALPQSCHILIHFENLANVYTTISLFFKNGWPYFFSIKNKRGLIFCKIISLPFSLFLSQRGSCHGRMWAGQYFKKEKGAENLLKFMLIISLHLQLSKLLH